MSHRDRLAPTRQARKWYEGRTKRTQIHETRAVELHRGGAEDHRAVAEAIYMASASASREIRPDCGWIDHQCTRSQSDTIGYAGPVTVQTLHPGVAHNGLR